VSRSWVPGDSGTVQQDDDSASVTNRRFSSIVAALGHDDPRFVRRFSPPRPGRPGAGHLMIMIGLAATLLLGALPLALGLHLQVTALLVVGAVGCLVLPLAGPVAVRVVLMRIRPLWS
jgi:hypothetical protein